MGQMTDQEMADKFAACTPEERQRQKDMWLATIANGSGPLVVGYETAQWITYLVEHTGGWPEGWDRMMQAKERYEAHIAEQNEKNAAAFLAALRHA